MFPALPDVDDDDDEVVREVKLWSLVTAREEQERRDRLNRQTNLARKPSDQNLRSSLTLQESSSLPELVRVNEGASGVDGSGSKTAVYSQIARPRPQSGRSAVMGGVSVIPGAGVPPEAVVPPPLPAVPPNARSRMQTDPVRIPSPPKPVPRNRQQVPQKPRDTSANRSQSLSPPFHRTNLASFSIADDLPAQNVVSDSPHDAPLIWLSPPISKYEQVDNFDLRSLDPFQPQQLTTASKSPVSKAFSEPVSQTFPMPTADSKASSYRSSPISDQVDWLHCPSSPFVGGNDVGGYPAILGFMPWVTNNLSSPSGPGYPISWMNEPSGNVPTSSSAVAEITDRSIHPGSVPSSGAGVSDLMDFSADEDRSPNLDPVYMNLADFDPLYTVDSKMWSSEQQFDSGDLFPRRCNALPRSAVMTATRPDRSVAPLPDVVAHSSVARLMSVEELQDPFSVQDLMISLEKKRQKHAVEQEAQELNAVSSQRVKPTHSVSAVNATPPRRKVMALTVELGEKPGPA